MKRELKVLDVFCIASGAMISSGLFVLPAIVYRQAGPSIILAYLLAAVMVVPAMFAKAELSTAMPKAGGTYFFVDRSLGPLFGTFAGLASWFSLSLKSAFALVGIGIFLKPFLFSLSPDIVKIVAIICTLLFMIINSVSVKHSGHFQVILVLGLIVILIGYILFGSRHIAIQRYEPFFKPEGPSLFFIAGTIFISFGGLTKVAAMAEEIKDPGRTIPAGMFSAFIIVTILYVLTVFVTVGVLDSSILQDTLTPISRGAQEFGGNFGFYILAAAAMLAFITTGNAGLLAASRNPMAMAKDHLLPSFFAKVSIRFETPVISTIITAVFMIICILFLDLEKLVKVASTMKLLLFALSSLSVIIMRMSRITTYKPKFNAPLSPYLQIAGVGIYSVLIILMGRTPLIITAGFFGISILWYFLFSRSRKGKDSALIHIVERISSKALRSSKLTDELRGILIERDEIVEDRFDAVILEAGIIDLPGGKIDADSLFDMLSDRFSADLGADRNYIKELLEQREKESTTVISEGLAIPHIVCEGVARFEMIVVRSKEGIVFGEGVPPVHIVFALAGSKDERNFHLQALMAIAQIVQNKDFLNNWLKVEDTEDLRNLILIAERVRKGTV